MITDTLYAHGNISYQDATDKDSGDEIPFTPEIVLYANLNWNFLPEWMLDAQYYWIGGRKRAANDPREDIKDNDLANLTMRRTHLFENWELAMAVRNLFNENVREPSTPEIPNDYPMEERSYWVELTYQF